jgi:hypothetical protein
MTNLSSDLTAEEIEVARQYFTAMAERVTDEIMDRFAHRAMTHITEYRDEITSVVTHVLLANSRLPEES